VYFVQFDYVVFSCAASVGDGGEVRASLEPAFTGLVLILPAMVLAFLLSGGTHLPGGARLRDARGHRHRAIVGRHAFRPLLVGGLLTSRAATECSGPPSSPASTGARHSHFPPPLVSIGLVLCALTRQIGLRTSPQKRSRFRSSRPRRGPSRTRSRPGPTEGSRTSSPRSPARSAVGSRGSASRGAGVNDPAGIDHSPRPASQKPLNRSDKQLPGYFKITSGAADNHFRCNETVYRTRFVKHPRRYVGRHDNVGG